MNRSVQEVPPGLGRVVQWPGGYAMSLGYDNHGVVRCCPGHPTPEEAKNHGITRLVEAASATADGDLALWSGLAIPSGQDRR